MNTQLKIIAKSLGFPTLEARNMDSLDFREVGVLQLADALEAAYRLGQKSILDQQPRKASKSAVMVSR